MISPEYIHYLVDTGLAVFLWKAVRALNRWYDVLTEYPPHKHVNGHILYPTKLAPGKMEKTTL